MLLTRSQNHDRLYTRSLWRSGAVYEQSVITSAIRNPKVLVRYIREGTKKRPYPRVEEIKWLQRNKSAQILANHFETVLTRESSLPEVVPQSRTDGAVIEYVQITCGDVKRMPNP